MKIIRHHRRNWILRLWSGGDLLKKVDCKIVLRPVFEGQISLFQGFLLAEKAKSDKRSIDRGPTVLLKKMLKFR